MVLVCCVEGVVLGGGGDIPCFLSAAEALDGKPDVDGFGLVRATRIFSEMSDPFISLVCVAISRLGTGLAKTEL